MQNFIIYFLIIIRITAMMIVAPFFSVRSIPNIVKLGMSLILSSLIASIYNLPFNISINSNFDLFILILNEIIIGLFIGYIALFVFNAIRISGQFIDFSIGFTMSQYYDPNTNSTSTNIERFFYWLSLAIFVTLNFHHIILSAIIKSFEVIPLGFFLNNEKIFISFIYFFSKSFYLGVKLAAPIVLVLFITEFTMGLIARAVPQINVFILGMPIKVIVGLLSISTILGGLIHMYIKLFEGLNGDFLKFFSLFPVIVLATDDKTEEPTPKKLKEAREKGQVAKSIDLTSSIILMGATVILIILSDFYFEYGRAFINQSFSLINKNELTYKSIMSIVLFMIKNGLIASMPIVFTVMILGIISNIAQIGLIISKEGLKPQLSKLNPINGFKRFFSKRSFIELFKSIAKISVIAYYSYKYVSSVIFDILKISDLNPEGIIPFTSKIINGQLIRLVFILFILGIIDFVIQKRQLKKELRMSKEEIKEEMKQTEGNPQIKSKIKQKQREIAMRRMMHEVPKATVVVTNPTHFAVALKYEKGQSGAPKVIAKGSDFLALKIKEVANKANVPIIENKEVARSLYYKCEINDEIPIELYQVVAEIIAYIYSLKK
ncbi:flagellar biosynthesis protein FlhB [Caloramator proteoclasticus]|uniref:Flagellar biosynthetic protein FliR n=1 Tax=Caloramator proteoclasticus DSM 10124 TaxID=1121262 RepID=A0A1M4SST2_9CLOT|nr:flagellar biosynthesis protein FlhB [Caloramator proteoclasticus]SHE35249.1 flagellar biosynthetic protein FliR/FlhB [Caloramator proteoclasticus DSM 10124]